MTKNLVLPIGGSSSRYPNMRPKWLLTHPRGTLMITEAIRGLDVEAFDSIVLIGLKEHSDTFAYEEELYKEWDKELGIPKSKIHIVLLDAPTRNQPETVAFGIKKAGLTGGILIKDCDNYFEIPNIKWDRNFIAVYDLHDESVTKPGNKSYVVIGDNNTVVNIVEKKVVSHLFCCGAYYFKDAQSFLASFEELKDHKDLYISHMIYQMILEKQLFFASPAEAYLDWGTVTEWRAYTSQYTTYFVDFDGVLVQNSGKHFEPKWGTTEGISENIAALNEVYDSNKGHIIITTSRSESVREETLAQIKALGIKYHRLVMELPHAKRVLVNDFSHSNPYPSARAINLKRNSKDLRMYLDHMK